MLISPPLGFIPADVTSRCYLPRRAPQALSIKWLRHQRGFGTPTPLAGLRHADADNREMLWPRASVREWISEAPRYFQSP